MKKAPIFLTIYFLSIFPIISFAQKSKEIKSSVSSVTVFSNRAMISRVGSLNLSKGQYELVISNLPSELNNESVRVSGKGTAEVKILDVKVETEFTTEIQEKEIQELQNKIDSLQWEDQIAADNIAILESQKNFIESLKAEAASEINKTIVTNEPNTSDWQNLLTFLRRNLTQIYEDLRKENLIRKRLGKETNAIRQKIAQTRTQGRRNFKLIRVSLLVQESGNVDLNASYIVNNASWYPIYDARVFADTKKLELTYFGMVRQSTGEDWKNIKLTLSTAQPLTAQTLPELKPFYLDIDKRAGARVSALAVRDAAATPVNVFYRADRTIPSGQGSIAGNVTDANTGEPLPGVNCVLEGTAIGAATDVNGNFNINNVVPGSYVLQTSYIGYKNIKTDIFVRERQILNMNISLQPSAIELEGTVMVTAQAPTPEKDFTYSLAEVQDKGISSVFEIPTTNTIPSDNEPHKVTIAIEPLDVAFEYVTVPKLAEKTFLKGKFVNQTLFPLLAGPINVFVENEFVNKSNISTIVPNDTNEIALGIDEGIKVTRKMINKFWESKGLFGGKKKVTFEFEIEVTNTKRTEERIEVVDQLPISRNEKVKIELLSPDKKDIRIDKQNRIKWSLALKPGVTIKLPLKYQIEFPADAEVRGLE